MSGTSFILALPAYFRPCRFETFHNWVHKIGELGGMALNLYQL